MVLVGLMAAACVMPTRASNSSVAMNAVMDGHRPNAEGLQRVVLVRVGGGWVCVYMYSHHVPGLWVDVG